MKKVIKKAYAKVNLTLEILGKARNDGFHDIASVMLKAENLYDVVCVEITCGDQINLECDKFVCESEDNLAYKAAKAYQTLYKEKTNNTFGANIYINKNIPFGAGLAGGSSDAAATLDALNELLGGLTEKETDDIALMLGSDVPFCLEKHKVSLCKGRGEIIEDLPLVNFEAIEFYLPKTPLITKGIYAEFDKNHGDDYSKCKSELMAKAIREGKGVKEIIKYMCNDFEEICIPRCEEISEGKKILSEKGFFAQMSGSGSAVFGIK